MNLRNLVYLGFALILTILASARSQTPATTPAAPTVKSIHVDFEKFAPGAEPEGFTSALTGGGGAVRWAIQEDPSAPSGAKALTQLSTDKTNQRYPLCICNSFSTRDVEVWTQFKPICGEIDQAGGLVARYTDRNNYYVVRANALEDNVRLYRVVNGVRTQFAGADVKVAPRQWHTLKLIVRGSHFQVIFNDKTLFEADDKTFDAAGKVGLWTKADSVSEFDNFNAIGQD
jgi:hypothetical protein